MTTVAWATDIHLDWADPAQRRNFFESLRISGADAAILSGDIGEGGSTGRWLREIAAALGQPIYFVLGNHDFYGRWIQEVRQETAQLAADCPGLVYLPSAGIVELDCGVGLVGHEGWGDARLGNFEGSQVFLPDFITIKDLSGVYHDRRLLRHRLEALGDESADYFARLLPEALARYRRVVLVTHVPPFREAAWHDGRSSDDDWLPFFSCRAVGDVLVQTMRRHPHCDLLVLCGHTHGSGEARMLDNLRVRTGGAEDRRPRIQAMLQLPEDFGF
jgi:3',5'-cyclic AMP phosphodiesterase CpdA